MGRKEASNEGAVWEQQAQSVLFLAGEVINRSRNSAEGYDYYKLVAKGFLHTANDDFRAVVHLVNDGLFTQVAVIVRRLFELFVNLRYIAKCPEKRAEQYLKLDPIQRHRYVGIWDGYDMEQMSEEDREWIQRMYNQVMVDLGDEQWRSSLKDRAVDVGGIWPKQYDYVYRVLCLHTHVSPISLANCFSVTPNGKLKYEQPLKLRKFVSRFAIVYFLSIIGKADEILGTGLGVEIDKLWKNIERSKK